MDFSSLLFKTSPQSLMALISMLLGVALWFIIRKKKQSQWLPILRIIKFRTRQLPKLRVTNPPYVLFLLFLLVAASFFFLSLRPSQKVYETSSSGPIKTHLFFDLSPSSAKEQAMLLGRDRLMSAVDAIISNGKITVSNSADFTLIEVDSIAAFENYYDRLKPHTAGLKLGNAFRRQLDQLRDIDQLIIVGDNDRYSWTGFNWRYLEDKMKIRRFPLLENMNESNVYVKNVGMLDITDISSRSWEVEISRTDSDETLSGDLVVSIADRIVSRKSWQMKPGLDSISLSVEIGQDFLLQDLSLDENTNIKLNNSDFQMKWKLDNLNEDRNAILIDDVFFTSIKPFKDDVLLVSQPEGEMFLEDVMHHFKLILKLIGFRVERFESWQENTSKYFDYPFWILVGGNRSIYNTFCPRDYLESRRLFLSKFESRNDIQFKQQNIWIFPNNTFTDYSQLCECYSSLSDPGVSSADWPPNYCRNIETRDQYVSVLKSLGAKQIGGKVGRESDALAWEWEDPDLATKILAFTIPPKPGAEFGLSYGDFPRLIRNLLVWTGVMKNSSATSLHSGLRRISDIASLTEVEIQKLAISSSNVPVGESVLKVIDEISLPEVWQVDTFKPSDGQSLIREKDDPTPWIKSIFVFVLTISMIEALYVFYKVVSNRIKKTALLFFVLVPSINSLVSDPIIANVQLNLIGYGAPKVSASSLSGDVSGRTSIDLSKKVNFHSEITPSLFTNGWIWANQKESVFDDRGRLDSRVVEWVRRGGFLVIENFNSKSRASITFDSGFREKDSWKPIPPDHEVMRSFHLLDSLPSCNNEVWWGYHFDDRIAIVALPYSIIDLLIMNKANSPCLSLADREQFTRIFINILMVALTTDYKKDQIHLPEILKRLR